MSDFIGDRQCVTHHYACDCREEHFKEIEDVLRWITRSARVNVGSYPAYLISNDAMARAKKAVKNRLARL